MDIIGIIVIFTMPYMAGYILKCIMNIREIRQIETYLTGFFFVFFTQGLVFFIEYFLRGSSFNKLCERYNIVFIAMAVVFVLLLLANTIIALVRGRGERAYKPKLHKLEYIFLLVALILMALVVYRVTALLDYLRDDIMLPTIRTTLATNTIYEYNPITSEEFTLGLINSKRLISLPIFYAYLCRTFGIDEPLLIYVVMTLITLFATFSACMLFITPVLRNRSKNIIFMIFLATLILSGDYYSGSIGYKLLWKGYAGETIVATVMLPYVMYVITDWYRDIRAEESRMSDLALIIVNTLKLLLCLLASIFITGTTTGLLLIMIEIIILGPASIVRYRIEEGKK